MSLPVWNSIYLRIPVLLWVFLVASGSVIYVDPINHSPSVRHPVKVPMNIPTCYRVQGMTPTYCTSQNPLYASPRRT